MVQKGQKIIGGDTMTGEARRKQIRQMLLEAQQPLTGTALAGALHVSRQVIV